MRGYRVPRKAGWDTHGLPVELEVERSLGIDGKKQIEEYGVAEFNKLCRESVVAYLEEWEEFTERIGFWVDLGDAYYTFTNEYIETVWWLLRQIWDKGLLYQGHKVVPYCPRCGTAISSHEVAQGYHDVRRTRSTCASRCRGGVGAADRRARCPVALAVWTTTPWTLISNVAAAVHPDVTYALVESRGERFVLARELVEAVLGKKAVVEREFARQRAARARLRGALRLHAGRHARPLRDRRRLRHDHRRHRHRAHRPRLRRGRHAVGLENDLPVVNAVDTEGRFIAR
jgi:isoleucyl-tRNA synthetase